VGDGVVTSGAAGAVVSTGAAGAAVTAGSAVTAGFVGAAGTDLASLRCRGAECTCVDLAPTVEEGSDQAIIFHNAASGMRGTVSSGGKGSANTRRFSLRIFSVAA
jgi:hypothetical protein